MGDLGVSAPEGGSGRTQIGHPAGGGESRWAEEGQLYARERLPGCVDIGSGYPIGVVPLPSQVQRG